MDELFAIALVVAILVLVLPIYLMVAVSRLKARVARLEADAVKREFAPRQSTKPEPVVEPEPQAIPKADAAPEPAAPSKAPATAWNPAPKVKRQKKSFVFTGEKIAQFTNWAKENWVFILAGVSLALAGVFLVQYGVEHGLLSPAMRVLAAIGFGGLLIGLGEFIRRKSAGDESGSFALLPSVFAGAGLVAIFAGVLSAKMLYGLIDQQAAFAGLALTGALAIVLGWVYGPLLATLGVFGALAAPFLVGGGSSNAGPLHLYFALIAAVALAIDAYKRWAWLSALAMIGAFAASALLLSQRDTGFYAVLFAFIVALLAVGVPVLSLTPRHSGPRLSSFLTKKLASASPEFPTRVASGGFVAASLYIGWIYQGDAALFWLALMVLGLLLLAAIFWMNSAKSLADVAFAPPIVALYVIGVEAIEHHAVATDWLSGGVQDVLETPPFTVGYLMAGAVAASLAFAWRSYFASPLKIANAAMAAGFAPWVAILLDFYWAPSYVIGAGNWALYLAGVALIMVGLTERFARIDTPDRTRTALFVLSSLSMVSFMLVVVLGDVALTLSLAVMVAAAAWLGEHFKLKLLDWYIQVGVITVSYRLVADPGLLWAFDAPLGMVCLAFGGVIALLAAAHWLKRTGRASVIVVLESAVWTLSGIFASLLLVRWQDATKSEALLYVTASFGGMVWLLLTFNQLYRLKVLSRLRVLRIVLAVIYGLLALWFLGIALLLSPVAFSEFKATGWPVFGSLGAAYLLPALMFGVMAWRLGHVPRWLRLGFIILASGFAAYFVATEIRHFWLEDRMARNIVLKPELYSYTVAMVLASVALLALAFMRQSSALRKLALVMVGLVVVKVFFIDMSGLDGLLRVASFLILGVVAALMAWVNRLLKANEAKMAT